MNIDRDMKKTIKKAVSAVFFRSGACTMMGYASKNTLTILTYHSFTLDSADPRIHSLPASELERQIIYLKKHYHIVPLSKGVEVLQQSGTEAFGNKPLVSITIDDGYSDNFDVAFPLLKKHGAPATVFVSTDFIDNRRPPWPSRLREILLKTRKERLTYPIDLSLSSVALKAEALKQLKQFLRSHASNTRFEFLEKLAKDLDVSPLSGILPLTWSQLRNLSEHGWDVGSHTVYHSMLPYSDAESRFKELSISKKRIDDELDIKCSLFSYPEGAWNHNSKLSVMEAGYSTGITQDWGTNKSHDELLLLKRIEVPYYEGLQTFACRVARVLRPSPLIKHLLKNEFVRYF